MAVDCSCFLVEGQPIVNGKYYIFCKANNCNIGKLLLQMWQKNIKVVWNLVFSRKLFLFVDRKQNYRNTWWRILIRAYYTHHNVKRQGNGSMKGVGSLCEQPAEEIEAISRWPSSNAIDVLSDVADVISWDLTSVDINLPEGAFFVVKVNLGVSLMNSHRPRIDINRRQDYLISPYHSFLLLDDNRLRH